MLTERARQLEKRYNEDWEFMNCYLRSNFVVKVMDFAKQLNPKNLGHKEALQILSRFSPAIGIQFSAWTED